MILLKSVILLHSDDLLVISPHSLLTVADPSELSFRPEATLIYTTGSLYPLSVLLAGSSDTYLICVQACETILGGWLHIRVDHILSRQVQVRWGPTVVHAALTVLIPGTPQGSHHCTSIRISSGLGWTGRGTGRFLPLWLRARPSLWCQCGHVLLRAVFAPNLDLLGVNMGLFVVITECATGRAVLLFLCGSTMNPANGCPTRGVSTKGISSRRGTGGGGVPVWWAGLSEGSGICKPSCLGTVVVTHWDTLFSSHGGGQHFIHVAKGNCRGDTLGHQLDWVSWAHLREDLLEGWVCFFSHLGLPLLMLPGQSDLPISILLSQPLYFMG